MLDRLPLDRDATVLDLGAGTGKLTQRARRPIRARDRRRAARRAARSSSQTRVPEADVRAGAAEEIPLEDASVDAVFAGQAFHWFANDAAVGEIARVLRPGGVLALLLEHFERHALRSRTRTTRGWRSSTTKAGPSHPTRTSSKRFPFGEEHEEVVEHEQVSPRDDVLALAASVSWIAMRDDRERDPRRARVRCCRRATTSSRCAAS